MRASLIALLLALGGCAPDAAAVLDDGHRAGGKADSADPPPDFVDQDGYVLRGSLDYDETGTAEVAGEAFDHRSGKHSVFPLTVYPDSTFDLALQIDDARMNERAEAWLVGPLADDGSWEEARAFEIDDEGRATLRLEATDYGSYAVIVGPGETLPRYPAPRARFRAAGSTDEVVLRFVPDLEGRTRLEPELIARELESTPRAMAAAPMAPLGFEILDPPPEAFDVTARESAPLRAGAFAAPVAPPMFRARSAGGEVVQYELVEWLNDMELIPERPGSELRASIARGATALTVHDAITGIDREHLIVDAIGADGSLGSLEPAMLVTVPTSIDGRAVEVIEIPDCDGDECPHTAVYAKDDGEYVESDQVETEQLATFRVAPSRDGEPSTFGLRVDCRGGCGQLEAAPRAAAAAPLQGRYVPRPKYPVYFAHGFNASHTSWDEIGRILDQNNPEWIGFHEAGDVPKHADVSVRAAALARNLSAFVARLTPLPGESYVRINVVAHSMGGLDTRYLMGHPDFNERCLETRTCVADVSGAPIYWRNRIASVTTLSTPHCGSRFSSWGREQLEYRGLNWAFRKVANNFMGMDETDQRSFESALNALSLEYHALVDSCAERGLPNNGLATDPNMPNFEAPVYGRQYPWACAAAGTCPTAEGHGPRHAGNTVLLPAPVGDATIFSWGSVTCVNGTCGDVVSPGLLVPYNIERQLGANDGVVATESARFGIYMGARPGDHLTWTAGENSTNTWAAWYYGISKAPIANFYAYWFDLLRRSGY